MVTLTIIQILEVILDVVWWIIIVQFVLSLLIVFNVVNTHSGIVRQLADGLDRVTDPLYRPVRRVLPVMGGIDFAPMIVLVMIQIIEIVLNNIAASVVLHGGM